MACAQVVADSHKPVGSIIQEADIEWHAMKIDDFVVTRTYRVGFLRSRFWLRYDSFIPTDDILHGPDVPSAFYVSYERAAPPLFVSAP